VAIATRDPHRAEAMAAATAPHVPHRAAAMAAVTAPRVPHRAAEGTVAVAIVARALLQAEAAADMLVVVAEATHPVAAVILAAADTPTVEDRTDKKKCE
jgi:hypothetical protein